MNWQERESQRFNNGEYTEIPVLTNAQGKAGYIPSHWAHVSRENPELIAFTVHADQGEKDIKRELRPGKYLKRYFPEWSDVQITEYCTLFSNENTPRPLKITQNSDESEEVSTYGPPHCMAKHGWGSGVHPHRVYSPEDGTDLAIAYIGEINDASAISIVYPAKKIFTTTYGDKRILKSLELAGYEHNNVGWEGAKILKIEEDGDIILPYIDQVARVDDAGEFLLLSHSGEYSAKGTNGIIDGKACSQCSEGCSDNYQIYNNDIYCDECYSETFDYCEHCKEAYPMESGGGYLENEEISLCDYCYSEKSADCEHSGERYLKTNMDEIVDKDGDGKYIYPDHVDESSDYIRMDDSNVYPMDCVAITEEGDPIFKEDAGECAKTGRIYHLDDLEEINGELYCHNAIEEGQLELFA